MGKRYLAVILMSMVYCVMMAQGKIVDNGDEYMKKQQQLSDSVAKLKVNAERGVHNNVLAMQPETRSFYSCKEQSVTDSLHLPCLTQSGKIPFMSSPYSTWWGLDTWQLHSGLNMNIGASVFASFGKRVPKGAGFAQNVSLMYALPLSRRISLAVGGWVSNAYWAHDRYTDAGISAVLGYKFDEHWEAYVYAQKSLMNKPLPCNFYTMQELSDRIGASVKYNFSPGFSVQVSVEAGERTLPGRMPELPKRIVVK